MQAAAARPIICFVLSLLLLCSHDTATVSARPAEQQLQPAREPLYPTRSLHGWTIVDSAVDPSQPLLYINDRWQQLLQVDTEHGDITASLPASSTFTPGRYYTASLSAVAVDAQGCVYLVVFWSDSQQRSTPAVLVYDRRLQPLYNITDLSGGFRPALLADGGLQVVVDSTQRLYLMTASQVWVAVQGAQVGYWRLPFNVTQWAALSVAVDARDRLCFLLHGLWQSAGVVYVVDGNGRLLSTVRLSSSDLPQSAYLLQLAVDSAGLLYVSLLYDYTPASGLIYQFASNGSLLSSFPGAVSAQADLRCLHVDYRQRLAVCNYRDYSLLLVTSSGQPQRRISSTVPSLCWVGGLAVDSWTQAGTQTLLLSFVQSSGPPTVYRLGLDGRIISTLELSIDPHCYGGFPSSQSPTVDSEGHLWLLLRCNERIAPGSHLVWSGKADGSYRLSWYVNASLQWGTSVAVSHDGGTVYVAGGFYLAVYDGITGRLQQNASLASIDPYNASTIAAMAVAGDGRLWAALQLPVAPNFLLFYLAANGSFVPGPQQPPYGASWGLAADALGSLYVVLSSSSSVNPVVYQLSATGDTQQQREFALSPDSAMGDYVQWDVMAVSPKGDVFAVTARSCSLLQWITNSTVVQQQQQQQQHGTPLRIALSPS